MLSPEHQLEQQERFKSLECVEELVGSLFYWLDLDGRLVGLNSICMKTMQIPNKEYVVGKNTHEFYPDNKDLADVVRKDIEKVLQTGIATSCIDKVIDVNGVIRYFAATRSALFSKDGKVILGIFGTSFEVDALFANGSWGYGV